MRSRILSLAATSVLVSLCVSASARQIVVDDYEYIDLGLSVKWCTVNTGVTSDRPYGWYYRWPDAMAIKNTDGSRMATKAEWNELLDLCTWRWTVQDGIGGYLVTSNIKGYKDRSIFLPAAGWLQDGMLMQTGTYASYWASTPGVQPDEESAYGFNFQRGATEWHSENRESEQSVRMVMPLRDKEVSKISIDRKKLNMEQGTTARLIVSMSGGKRNVNSSSTWKSSDESVVSVTDDGLIVAVAPGKCEITVQAYGQSALCAVTVTPREVEFTDLGLGVLWATCNIGASRPSDYGDYYAWAEVEPKEFYAWSTYRYCSFGQQNGMDKYTAEGYSHQYLKADNMDRLEPVDDIASVLSGGNWRMPTSDDFKELLMNCVYASDTIDGVEGLRFTSQVPGFEDRSIFIPYAGCINGNEPKGRDKEFYIWSSSAGRGNQGEYLYTRSTFEGSFSDRDILELLIGMPERSVYVDRGNIEPRFVGMSVRPVKSLDDDMFKSLSFSQEHLDMQFGETRAVEVLMMPAEHPVNESNVIWSSSDPKVADVAGGSVTAAGNGNCVITAESAGHKARMSVSVTLSRPEPVDLGLSVMWASANLGASSPEEPGGYFAWGETNPKPGLYTSEKYKFGQYTNAFTKYNFYTSSWGGSDCPLDYKETLDPEDDAAAVLLGEGWRMPTADELWELRTKCTWKEIVTESESDGYKFRTLHGYVVTSNVPGYEDRSIYIPAAGAMEEYSQKPATGVHYWTSTLGQTLGNERRWYGNTVRPVMELPESESRKKAEPDPVKPLNHKAQVDLGLSVLWADCNVGADRPEECGARFAWGETSQKTYYSEVNYKHMKAYADKNKWWYSKYTASNRDPYVDGMTRLSLEDDAAQANWGGKWRIPTKEEYAELFEKCEWRVDYIGGVKGYRITSKVPGYTSNSIFLPYSPADIMAELSVNSDRTEGTYMTSDLSAQHTDRCVLLRFSKYEFGTLDEVDLGLGMMANIHILSSSRWQPYNVRAVCDR